MSYVFHKITFRKLTPDQTVATRGDKVFKKLTVARYEPSTPVVPPPIIGIHPDNFNLGLIGLKPGTYTLAGTVSAPSLHLAESEHSEPVEYTVK